MATAEQAILAIRHAVQDHGDERYRLGSPASLDNMRWFGRLLGWDWPPSYSAVLDKHDGAIVKGMILFSFSESIDLILLFQREWHRPDGYWPVSTDECGNYFALSFGRRDPAGECPVVFLEYGNQDHGVQAATYADFVLMHVAEELCARGGCSSPRAF